MTIENIEDEDGENFEQQLLANKIRGFRRTGPSQPAERNKGSGKTDPKPSFAAVTAKNGVANNESERAPAPPTNTPKLYCHYFNNSGNCSHGNKCKFVHSKAPVCSFDANCNRKKCMFQHPLIFLLGCSPKWIQTCSTLSGMAQPEQQQGQLGKHMQKLEGGGGGRKNGEKSFQVHTFSLLGTNSNGLKAKKASLENAVKFFNSFLMILERRTTHS